MQQLINNQYTSNQCYKTSHKLTTVFLKETRFVARNILTQQDIFKAYKLRHSVFCEELKWVVSKRDKLEIDDYDKNTISFGVFDDNEKLIAYLRIVLSSDSFMLEKEFSFLLTESDTIRKKDDTIEISRLCVAPEARSDIFSGNFGVHTTSMLLYKCIYHWCIKNNKRFIYMVVEKKILRLLCARGFPCELIGKSKIMPDGLKAVAAILDWRKFEEKNYGNKIGRWFSEYQSTLQPVQLRQHVFYSLHQA